MSRGATRTPLRRCAVCPFLAIPLLLTQESLSRLFWQTGKRALEFLLIEAVGDLGLVRYICMATDRLALCWLSRERGLVARVPSGFRMG